MRGANLLAALTKASLYASDLDAVTKHGRREPENSAAPPVVLDPETTAMRLDDGSPDFMEHAT